MILSLEEKTFVDIFCRLTLLEFISTSIQKNNNELIDFVINEATYENILLMISKKISPNIIHEDVGTDAKIREVERTISPFMNFGLALLGGGLTHGGLQKLSAIGGMAVPGGAVGTLAVSMLASMGISWGYSLLSKVIKTKLSRVLDKNKKQCAAKFKNDLFAPIKSNICLSDSKINEYKNLIADIQTELNKCPQTLYPERCQSSLLRKIADFKEQMNIEQGKAIQLRKRLQIQMVKKNISSKNQKINQGQYTSSTKTTSNTEYNRSNIV